jgi:hypothetical protein
MTWIWRLETADGTAANPAESAESPAQPVHPTQSDAETWLGESWRRLASEGVARASLYHENDRVYGPMLLQE